MKLVISGIPLFDGEYPMDGLTFTNREMHRIKQVSGLRGGEVLDALMNDDWGGYVAVAAVVIERSGRPVDVDDLWDAPAGTIRIDARTEKAGEGDAGPPDGTTSGDGSSEPSESGTSSGGTSA